ncbi:hypothetical protein PRVXT_002974 [Proteinivorax tanatarense]|uniref:Membrane protein YkvI n=1 Tax=Proteinivorax tanatarense TaxID=1260629 RepID=A0AAU7VLA3_9FIRM
MEKRGIKLALTYCGAIIGAGFATGQEVVQFFSVFKLEGILGGGIATAMFIFFAYVILDIVLNEKISDHKDLINVIVGKKGAIAFDFIIMFFLFSGFTIMISAAVTLLTTYIITSKTIAVIVFLIMINLIFYTGMEGVIKANSILVPILVIFIIFLSLRAIFITAPTIGMGGLVPQNAFIAATSYVSYNLIIGMVVLSSFKKEIYNKKDIFVISVVGGGILGTMLMLVIVATKDISNYSQIPIMDLAYGLNQLLFNGLVLSLLIAILTSAIATGHGIINRVKGIKNWSYSSIGLVLSITATPLSFIGFEELVKSIYPFFGFINYIIMLALIYHFVKRKIITTYW